MEFIFKKITCTVFFIVVIIETRAEVWENEKCCGNTSRQASVSTAFCSSPKLQFHEVAIISIN